MAKHLPSIRPYGIAKKHKEKFEKLCKKKAFQELQPWVKAIINHFWWSCSNCGECGEITRYVDKSFIPYPQHTRVVRLDFNVHIMCSCTTNCPRNNGKKWISGTSPAYAALQSIVLDVRLIKDLPNLALFKHSENIEVFHNLMLKYCPKRLKFSYEGMIARTQFLGLWCSG